MKELPHFPSYFTLLVLPLVSAKEMPVLSWTSGSCLHSVPLFHSAWWAIRKSTPTANLAEAICTAKGTNGIWPK